MKLTRLLPLTAAMAVLAGCSSSDAFIDRNYAKATLEVSKPKPAGYDGQVRVCYGGDTPREDRDRLAEEACTQWGLHAVLILDQPWQCRLLVPHLATYACVDPAMRFKDGRYVDPFSTGAVDQWRNSQPRQPAEGDTPTPTPTP
ncbi:hypothetical protein [Phaeospirillum tilakii]|uniref:Lipoprotein n=1 Tax=Phaeospirillum tilakii TaxID=741673 RepID=A0ABW5CBT2_9PROT